MPTARLRRAAARGVGRVTRPRSRVESRRTVVGGAGVEARGGRRGAWRGLRRAQRRQRARRQQAQVVEGGKATPKRRDLGVVPLRQVVMPPGGARRPPTRGCTRTSARLQRRPSSPATPSRSTISPTHDTRLRRPGQRHQRDDDGVGPLGHSGIRPRRLGPRSARAQQSATRDSSRGSSSGRRGPEGGGALPRASVRDPY